MDILPRLLRSTMAAWHISLLVTCQRIYTTINCIIITHNNCFPYLVIVKSFQMFVAEIAKFKHCVRVANQSAYEQAWNDKIRSRDMPLWDSLTQRSQLVSTSGAKMSGRKLQIKSRKFGRYHVTFNVQWFDWLFILPLVTENAQLRK